MFAMRVIAEVSILSKTFDLKSEILRKSFQHQIIKHCLWTFLLGKIELQCVLPFEEVLWSRHVAIEEIVKNCPEHEWKAYPGVLYVEYRDGAFGHFLCHSITALWFCLLKLWSGRKMTTQKAVAEIKGTFQHRFVKWNWMLLHNWPCIYCISYIVPKEFQRLLNGDSGR